MQTIYREDHTQLWLTIQSSEQLGVLDTGYIENYFGVDGRLSLYHRATGNRYSVTVAPVDSKTPGVTNDVFRGFIAMNSIPNGVFEVQGRVRDEYGHRIIIGSLAEPDGTENKVKMQIEVKTGDPVRLGPNSTDPHGVIIKTTVNLR